MFYFLRGPHLHGNNNPRIPETEKDRDDAVRAYRLSSIAAAPIEWNDVRAMIPPDASGRYLVWGDFPNGGPTRISDYRQRGEVRA